MTDASKLSPREQAATLADGCEHVETRAELEARIAAKGRLHVKLGIDPTGAFLHLGHAVVLHKMQQFVEFGHRVTLLIGDYTARIGDPSGRNESRPALTGEQIEANMREYQSQAGTVLDLEQIEVMHNSTWLKPLTLVDLIRLMSQTTLAQVLDREDFSKRYKAGVPIALHELLYPIAQAYDSVAMACDVELGGSDQLFNLMMGRDFQRHAGQTAQICMTLPILEGTDGAIRMGKSRGNWIGLTEPAAEQFGKLMSLPDAILPRYAWLAAFWPKADCDRLALDIAEGRVHPMDAKKALAEAIVARYHGAQAAAAARERFAATVQRRELPADLAEASVGPARTLVEALIGVGFAHSKREAERLVAGGGVRIDGAVCADPKHPIAVPPPLVLQVGSRRFVRLIQ
ncbi:MAG: tyrosine--tRNA ligase [Vulcanimicrobiaceae bacterium]